MRKKVYYLATCDTCKRIMKEVGVDDSFEKQEIKTEPIQPRQLDELKAVVGSYDGLFSRISRKYKELGLSDKKLTEKEIRQFILDEYTFLKRPVFVIGDHVFAGNSKSTIEAVKECIKSNKA